MFDNYPLKNKKQSSSDGTTAGKKNINLLPDNQQVKPVRASFKAKGSTQPPLHIPASRFGSGVSQPSSWLSKIKQLVSRVSASGDNSQSVPHIVSEKTSQNVKTSAKKQTTPPLSHLQTRNTVDGLKSPKVVQNKKITANSQRIPITKQPFDVPHSQIKFHQILEGGTDEESSDLDVNLLPAQKRHFTPNQIFISYTVLIIVLSLLIIMPYINYYFQNRSLTLQAHALQQQLELIKGKNKQTAQQATAIKPFWLKLQNLKKILNNHIYWSDFFSLLEHNTAANVYFTNLSAASSDMSIKLEGEALRLRDVAEQLIIFQNNPLLHNIKLGGLSFLEAKTELDPKFKFNISFNLSDGIIKKDSQYKIDRENSF